MSMPLSKPIKYRADIDGLRGIAILYVISFHAFPEVFTGGFIGVDIFFVISGYLISSIIFENLKNDTFSFIEFYSRRIRRIFPALLLLLLVCLVLGWLTLLPDEYQNLGKHAAAGAAFVSNLINWQETGYFNTSAHEKPLLHLWSLGIEEQFYIVWPVLVFVIWKKKLSVVQILGLILLGSFAINIWLSFTNAPGAFYSPLSRFWELSIGSALAYLNYLPAGNPLLEKKSTAILSVAGLIFIILGYFTINGSLAFPGFWALLPVIGTALLVYSGPDTLVNRWLLSNKMLIWVGLISYPLYLWHWSILTFLYIYDGSFRQLPKTQIVLAVAVSFILAWLTYRFIEKPIRHGLGHRRAKTIALACGVGISCLLGFLVFENQGYTSRIHVKPESALTLFKYYPHPTNNTFFKEVYPSFENSFPIRVLSKPHRATVAIVGDSHSNPYYHSFATRLPKESVVNIAVPECFPFVGSAFASRQQNIEATKELERFIAENESVKSYILTGYFSVLIAGGFKNGNWEGLREAKTLSEDQKVSFIRNGEILLSSLLAKNKKVYVILDIPDVIIKPISCVQLSPPFLQQIRIPKNKAIFFQGDDIGISRQEFERRIKPYDQALQELLAKFPQVKVYNPRPLLCDDNHCWIFKNGIPLYWNSDHLTLEGGDLVVEGFLKQFPGVG